MQIKLQFDTELRLRYFGYLFPKLQGDGAYRVSTTEPMGQLLCARARDSAFEPRQPQGPLVATLELPLNPATRTLENKFIYYSREDTYALMMALSATFDLDFAGYYRKGESLGYRRKDIVEAFIVSRNLAEIDPSDALYKRAYRATQKRMQELTARLLRRCYYLDESINLKGLKDDKDRKKNDGDSGIEPVVGAAPAGDDSGKCDAGDGRQPRREWTLFDQQD